MRRLLLLCLLAVLIPVAPAGGAQGSRFHEGARSPGGMVVTESPAASRAGRAVLERGGNAIDAAVTTVLAMGVVRPQSCGIGGGGFLVHRSADGKARTLDFRETAPGAFTATTLDGPGLHKSFTGHLTVGVPGTLAGMDAALRRFGTIELREALAPAERLARLGFRVPTSMSGAMRENADRLRLFPAAAEQFLEDGQPLAPGATLTQPVLAATLRRLIRGGPSVFYGGTIARRIVRDMRAARPETKDPGLLTVGDFRAYRALWRPALRGTFRGREVITMGPPTSGGIALLQMLNVLEGFDLKGLGRTSAKAIHLVAEAEKLAFADRGTYVADPGFVDVPTARLVDKGYAEQRRALIGEGAGTYGPGAAGENPVGSTTHVSVIDAQGDAVAVTCTIEQEFGSAVVAPGTGILLNNELTDFGPAGTANEPGPGKRPRSSMSPTIVAADGKPTLVTGGAGGVRIIMGVVHAVLDHVEHGMTLPQIADAERWDNQGGRTLEIEDARVDPAVLADLESRGHVLRRLGEYGARPRMQSAGFELATNETVGVSDSRSDRAALGQRVGRPAPPVRTP